MAAPKLFGFALDVLAAVLAAIFFAFALPKALTRAVNLLVTDYYLTGESLTAARTRFYGDDYVQAIDRMRRELDDDEPYLLVEAGNRKGGGVYWVRYDLAPRRAVLLGRVDEITPHAVKTSPASLRHVIVAFDAPLPPRLFDRHTFVADLERLTATAPSAAPPGAATSGTTPPSAAAPNTALPGAASPSAAAPSTAAPPGASTDPHGP